LISLIHLYEDEDPHGDFFSRTGTGMMKKFPLTTFTETGMGMWKFLPHGDGGGGLTPDDEFSVAIFMRGWTCVEGAKAR